MTPMPPSRAIPMANLDSVTVSIAADRSGTLSLISAASRVLRSTSLGRISAYWGTKRRSSNVSPSENSGLIMINDASIEPCWGLSNRRSVLKSPDFVNLSSRPIFEGNRPAFIYFSQKAVWESLLYFNFCKAANKTGIPRKMNQLVGIGAPLKMALFGDLFDERFHALTHLGLIDFKRNRILKTLELAQTPLLFYFRDIILILFGCLRAGAGRILE